MRLGIQILELPSQYPCALRRLLGTHWLEAFSLYPALARLLLALLLVGCLARYFLEAKSKSYPYNSLASKGGSWEPSGLKICISLVVFCDEAFSFVVALPLESIVMPFVVVVARSLLLSVLVPALVHARG